jgi:hypothetical protein
MCIRIAAHAKIFRYEFPGIFIFTEMEKKNVLNVNTAQEIYRIKYHLNTVWPGVSLLQHKIYIPNSALNTIRLCCKDQRFDTF